jgi:hypothetical protein
VRPITDGTAGCGGAAGWVKGRSTVRNLQRWVTGHLHRLGVATALSARETLGRQLEALSGSAGGRVL